MTMWKAHKLAGEAREQLRLESGERVVATTDLPGVPQGTRGVVVFASGFAWLRYRVRFENGVELTFLDGRHIEPASGKR